MNRETLGSNGGLAAGLEPQYGGALRHYMESQGRGLPALAYEICIYLADCYACDGGTRMDPTLAAIGRWHRENDFPDPTLCPSVITLVGQIRRRTRPPYRPALQPPPSIADVMYLADLHERFFCRETPAGSRTGDDSSKPIPRHAALVARRNRAILLIGFWFGMTTAEVCKLRRSDVTITDSTLKITSDRIFANGCRAKYSYQLDRLPLLCPLAALERWFAVSSDIHDNLFYRTTRRALPGPVDSRSVHENFNKILRKNNGLELSIKSLRYSLYFFLAENGWSRQKILQHVPFYRRGPTKTRLLKTARDIPLCKPLSTIRAADLSSLTSIIERGIYQAA